MKDKKSSVGFSEILGDIIKYRKLFLKVLSVAFIFGVIISFSIPSTYKCQVLLSPEMSNMRSSSSLASLASSFGVNLKGALGNYTEALFPTLYPDLMNSVDFKTSLFQIPVTIEGDKDEGEPDRVMSYYDYLKDERKKPWWSAIIGSAKDGLVGLFNSEDEDSLESKVINPFRLTKQQTRIMKLINRNVVCDVDRKTMVIEIEVKDQDPLICATMADSVKMRLQNFITDYRTNKARVDYEYNLKLSKEAEARYEKACQDYSNFSDKNQKIFLQEFIMKQEKLENEMQVQRRLYQQVIAQLQEAEMRIQAQTPAFTTLQSATVPLKRESPNRKMIVLLFLFLAFAGTTIWVLYKEKDLVPLLGFSLNWKDYIKAEK